MPPEEEQQLFLQQQSRPSWVSAGKGPVVQTGRWQAVAAGPGFEPPHPPCSVTSAGCGLVSLFPHPPSR